ncbi:alkaline phosphatase D family protein [Povalibacter sp.]|uniref:alkaline phosphatase D family protein n=1 Tax=Povalibacter sp. TaxID=1962978 RepID=UPI002F429C72
MFGDINLQTTFQTIHFARTGMITTRGGRNEFIRREQLDRWRGLPTLSIHGDHNRLADIATLTRMHVLMRSVNPAYQSFTAEGFGHQDCIIGQDAPGKVFPQIRRFLDAPKAYQSPTAPPAVSELLFPPGEPDRVTVQAPWTGPVLGLHTAATSCVVAADQKLGRPYGIGVVAVELSDDRTRYQIPSHTSIDWQTPVLNAIHDRRAGMQAAMVDGTAMYTVTIPQTLRDFDEPLLLVLAYDEPPALGMPAPLSTDPQIQQWLYDATAHYLRFTPAVDVASVLLIRQQPNVADEHVKFILASCQYPAGPLDPSLASRSYRRIESLLNEPAPPQFMVLTGDQVYTDATAGLMDATRGDDRYQRPYEEFLRTRAVRSVWRRIPVLTMFDDHEIRDNWHRGLRQDDIENAKIAYLKFQRTAGPPWQPSPQSDPMWYELCVRKFPFFFVDTRTERLPRTATSVDRDALIDERQLAAVTRWLDKNQKERGCTPKFIVSPSILIPRRLTTLCDDPHAGPHHGASALLSDAWDGFPASMHALLQHIVDGPIQNVIFLSGDEHHSCHASATLSKIDATGAAIPGSEVVVHSIHSSGLYSPYVFANGFREELIEHDTFLFPASDPTHQCTASLSIDAPGDGFAVIECSRQSGRWLLTYAFHKSADDAAPAERHTLILNCDPQRHVGSESEVTAAG